MASVSVIIRKRIRLTNLHGVKAYHNSVVKGVIWYEYIERRMRYTESISMDLSHKKPVCRPYTHIKSSRKVSGCI